MADLALSWRDHHNVLISVFEKLLEQKALVDCTLAAEGKFLKAHKIVLSACSPYLEALLNQENDKHPIIFLRDVQFEDLKTLVEFVYSGEIKITEDRLVEFLSVAEALQIKGLGGADNEVSSKKSVSESTKKRGTISPVPRKRSRRHSNESNGKSQEKHDEEIVRENSESQQSHISHINISSVRSMRSSLRKSTVTEGLTPSIIKIKEEVASTLSGVSVHIHSEQSQPEHVPNETTEEILGLKPEFEEVTFTEEYSEDLLPEDGDSVEHIPDPDQPSSSQEFSGFSSDPVASGGLAVESPFMVNSGEQRPSEGRNKYLLDSCNGVRPTQMRVCISSTEAEVTNEVELIEEAASGDMSQLQMGQRPSTSLRSCTQTYEERKRSVTREGNVYSVDMNSSESIGGERAIFYCEACNKKFTSSKHFFYRHLLTHSGQFPFRCEFCFKGFINSTHLREHLRSHTGERPFLCSVCGKTFILRSHLKRHQLTKHPKQLK